MSIKLMSRAWDTNQKANDLLVLLALCDFANEDGVCFPSLETLANKAKVGKSTLCNILNAYEEIGVIKREKRKRKNNSNTSTIYTIQTLDFDSKSYKEAYQKSRKYEKKIKNLSKEIKPKTIPFKNKNTNNNPKAIIDFYKENISSLNADISEPSSFNQILLKNDYQAIMNGLKNYADSLKNSDKKPEKLFFFVRDNIYKDYQNSSSPSVKRTISVPSKLVNRKFNVDGEIIKFESDGYLKINKNWKVTSPENVLEMINMIKVTE